MRFLHLVRYRYFFFQAEDGIRDLTVTGVQTCALPICIVRCHLQTMARMNVDYDLLTWEGDILRLKFWAQAFDVLKAKQAIYLQTEGRLQGCWVMPIQEDLEDKGDAGDEEGGEEREKVIVRSNGVVTYVGKDIAYQFWKLGLLGRDFRYRIFADRAQGPLWATTSQDGTSGHPL